MALPRDDRRMVEWRDVDHALLGHQPVDLGLGIVLAEPLNNFMVPGTGFPVGFWFAQQGSIYVFVVLIFVYVWLMNRLDKEFGVDEGGES